MMRLTQIICVFALLLLTTAAFAQTGKISGTVTDAETGEPLPGVNVVIEGTQQGATTNTEGFYNILNVSPGTYDVRASFVGFTPTVREGVQVNIDLTTEVDFALQEQTEQLEEVTVQATEPVVKRDISANVANVSAESIEDLPVTSVEEVVGLQAGIEPGLSVRGSNASEVSFVVDGMSMRQGRSNEPFTGISYTAIEEVQVQTGGFNAEYGNVRSGLINVVTKEGPRDHYAADVILSYSPPSKEYFGLSPNDPNAYWMRPYLDSDVAFVGTDSDESPWDEYTQRQYPEFQGWNSIAQQIQNDDDLSNDLTAQELQDVFLFRHRKSMEIETPDLNLDANIGGPIPLLSKPLGDLRFSASYRQTQNAYVIPQMRDAYRSRLGQIKLTSNPTQSIKLQLLGLYSKQLGINASYDGGPAMYQGEMPPYPWSNRGMIEEVGRDETFANEVWEPQDVTRSSIGAELTHTLNSSTFYEVQFQRMFSEYFTRHGRERNHEVVKVIGGMELDEAPFGWEPQPANSYSGLRLGGHWGGARDSSELAVWTGSFDITSQVNQYALMKAGLSYVYNDYYINHEHIDEFILDVNGPKSLWRREPTQGAAYTQTKLEFEGMVANLGLRLDYFNPRGKWYKYDPYTQAFSDQYGFATLDEVMKENPDLDIDQVPTEYQFALSPRLGVSYPITESSKLFFNYGHFRQMLEPRNLFNVRKVLTGQVDRIGNPNQPMPQTVAYEVGYEHNLFDQYLLRIGGYYKALDKQPRNVQYTGISGNVSYEVIRPYNYEDIRGAEITLTKNTGKWLRGFINFTYMAVKQGNFGFARRYESRVEQRQFERESRAHYQEKPVPEPYARFNLEFFSPADFGPRMFGLNPLGDWHLSFLGEWRAGQVFTWSGGGSSIPGLQNNVRWADYYNLDLRLSTDVNTTLGKTKLFVDVSNALNLKRMNRYAGFEGPNDQTEYMQSLHLPADAFEDIGAAPYAFIPGEDQPGDYRKAGVEFVPIEVVGSLPDKGNLRALYYEQEPKRYMVYENGAWKEADQSRVDQVLEDKAYIDMPNESYFTFLNPRSLRFGIRISL